MYTYFFRLSSNLKSLILRLIASFMLIIGVPMVALANLLALPFVWLVIALTAYWVAARSGAKPYGPTEFLDWFARLNPEQQSSVASSTLVIVGIFGALTTAYYSWRRQKRIEMKIATTLAVYSHFKEIGDNILKLRASCSWMVEYKLALHAGEDVDSEFTLELVNSNADEYLQAKQNLYRMFISTPQLRTLHSAVLTHISGGISGFEHAVKVTTEASDLVYGLMSIRPLTPGLLDRFATTDEFTEERFVAFVDGSFPTLLAGISGAAMSAMKPIFGPNVTTMFRGVKDLRTVAELYKNGELS